MHEMLKEMRKSAGMKPEEVAAALGVDRSAVYFWESGAHRPEPERLHALLDLYGASDEERLEAWRLRSLPRPKAEPDAVAEQAS